MERTWLDFLNLDSELKKKLALFQNLLEQKEKPDREEFSKRYSALTSIAALRVRDFRKLRDDVRETWWKHYLPVNLFRSEVEFFADVTQSYVSSDSATIASDNFIQMNWKTPNAIAKSLEMYLGVIRLRRPSRKRIIVRDGN